MIEESVQHAVKLQRMDADAGGGQPAMDAYGADNHHSYHGGLH